jgi:hypothetical protein
MTLKGESGEKIKTVAIARTRNRPLEVIATVAHAISWSWVAYLNVPCSSIIWVIPGRDLYRVDHRLVQLCVRELICFTISSPDGHGDWGVVR